MRSRTANAARHFAVRLIVARLAALVLTVLAATPTRAASIAWTGSAGDGQWTTAINWSPAQVPGSVDDVTIDLTNTVTAASAISFNSLVLGDPSGLKSPRLVVSSSATSAGAVTINPSATLVQNSTIQLSFGSVNVLPGGSITHFQNSAARAFLVNVAVSGDFNLQAGATIAASGLGYAGANENTNGPGQGPGAGQGVPGNVSSWGGGGAGHGGNGGNGRGFGGPAYDSATNPTDLGSGGGGGIGFNCAGGPGGSGGGAVLISAGGALTINGLVSVNGSSAPMVAGCPAGGGGGDGAGGGGSGGTINLSAGTLAGSGTLLANGGQGGAQGAPGGGGGGGRVAIVVNSSDHSSLTIQANSGALGGSPSASGGAGTIAILEPGNPLYNLTIGGPAVLTQSVTPIHGAAFSFNAGAFANSIVAFDAGSSANINSLVIGGNASVSAGTLTFAANGSFEVRSGAVFQLTASVTSGGNLIIDGGATFEQMSAAQLGFNSVNVAPNAVLTHAPNTTTRSAAVNVSAAGSFNLQAGAMIMADGLGYAGAGKNTNGPGQGPGAGGGGPGNVSSWGGGGAGHGSAGGNGRGFGGPAYDSATNPTDLGSGGGGGIGFNCAGGPGGSGGGAVLISAGGALTINGLVSVNGSSAPMVAGCPAGGGDGAGGGGSGGTINLTGGTLAGSGSLLANGGQGGTQGAPGGGGAGGRIAITISGSDTSSLTIAAKAGPPGGSPSAYGGLGVIAARTNGAASYTFYNGSPPVAGPISWTGAAGDGLWSSVQNWSPAQIPIASNQVTIDSNGTVQITGPIVFSSLTLGDPSATAKPVIVFSTSVSVSGASVTISSGATLVQNTTAQLTFGSINLNSGGVITHPANNTAQQYVVNINVPGNFTIQPGGVVATDGLGFVGSSGPGAGSNPNPNNNTGFGATGGGHGGFGGLGAGDPNLGGTAYDDVFNPLSLGSGGGPIGVGAGGSGGGAVIIRAGTLALGGAITANGTAGAASSASNGGGGSGGTINLSVATLTGFGSLQANGGSGGRFGGGGGGGRVAIAVSGSDTSTLGIFAHGGLPSLGTAGGAGTIVVQEPGSASYSLTIGDSFQVAGSSTLVPGSNLNFGAATFQNALVAFDNGSTVDLNSLVVTGTCAIYANSLSFPSNGAVTMTAETILQVTANATSGGNWTIGSGGLFEEMNASQLGFASVLVQPGALMTHAANATTRASVLDLNVSGNFTLQAGATIAVDGLGYAGSAGPGAGSNSNPRNNTGAGATGGGHGGAGGLGVADSNPGGVGYDNTTNPMDLGSGGGPISLGPGGSGGGAVIVQVGGTLALGGLITANGSVGATSTASNGGGGAGGTINLSAGTMTGSGVLQASGGYGGAFGGGGGGGLIAIRVSGSDQSALTIIANGGASGTGGGTAGGAGIAAIQTSGGASYGLTVGSPAATVNSNIIQFSPSSNVTLNSLVALGTVTLTAGVIALPSALEVTPGTLLSIGATAASGGNLLVEAGGTFSQGSVPPMSFASVLVQPGGVLTHGSNSGLNTAMLNLSVSGNFFLPSGAQILLDGLGYPGGAANAAGVGAGGGSAPGAGGGHGGTGGNGGGGAAGGTTYDSAINPVDPGSGGAGGSGNGGNGGGAAVLQVGGVLTLGGVISANGGSGSGGGGAGGTVNIGASSLSGSGTVRANGGSGSSGYGGGGGGRIVLAYGSETGSLTTQVNGGAGSNAGAAGSFLNNGQAAFSQAASTSTTASQMQGQLSSNQGLTADMTAQTINFVGAAATGTAIVQGTFTSGQMKLVTFQSGPYSGDGFFSGTWGLTLQAGNSLFGQWEGAAYLTSSPRQLVIRGVLEGGIRCALEGALTESVPGSGNFNQLSAACSAIQVGSESGGTSIYLNGTGNVAQTTQYPGTPLTQLQTTLSGQTSGYAVGPLATTFTLVTVNSSGNPYNGQGFFLPTFTSSLGPGVGWAYATTNFGAVNLEGLFEQPLRTLFEGALNTAGSGSLFFTLERLDIGAPIQPQLNVTYSFPGTGGSGAVGSFSMTITNTGYAVANGVTAIAIYPNWTDFVSATGNYTYYLIPDWYSGLYYTKPFVRWDFASIPPRSTTTLVYQGRFRNPTVAGPAPHSFLGDDVQLVTTAYANQLFGGYPQGGVQ